MEQIFDNLINSCEQEESSQLLVGGRDYFVHCKRQYQHSKLLPITISEVNMYQREGCFVKSENGRHLDKPIYIMGINTDIQYNNKDCNVNHHNFEKFGIKVEKCKSDISVYFKFTKMNEKVDPVTNNLLTLVIFY